METKPKTELKQVHYHQSINQSGHRTQIEIYVGIDREFTEAETKEFSSAGARIAEVIQNENYRLNERYREEGEENTQKLIDLFGDRKIFVERIENQYWKEDVHNPWLIVTTNKGHIMIGWRKRVINIDWTRSTVTAKAEQLFPDEGNVTKSSNYDQERYIHAWGYEKAQEYINKILA